MIRKRGTDLYYTGKTWAPFTKTATKSWTKIKDIESHIQTNCYDERDLEVWQQSELVEFELVEKKIVDLVVQPLTRTHRGQITKLKIDI
jgi:hypothetical protein